MLKITSITINGQTEPMGLEETPSFSWVLHSDRQNVTQTFYELTVRGGGEIWQSGRHETSQSQHIPCGISLKPACQYTVELTVSDNIGETADYTTSFETGLLGAWKAQWITDDRSGDEPGCPIFFKDFAAKKTIKTARLYATALGVYDVILNGNKCGKVHMAPGWTNYKKRLEYRTYDVARLLKRENRLEMTVGKGWYRGVVGYYHTKNFYGDRAAALAELHITYEDGSQEIIATGSDWEWTTGPVRDSEIYDGETIDFTVSPEEPRSVKLYPHTMKTLVSQECAPAREITTIAAKKLIQTPAGETVIDFGQNLTGFVRAVLHAPRGTEVRISHAEVLDENGNFYTENLRAAKAMDTIICSGGEDSFAPRFTYHGFRYIKVEGLGTQVRLDDFTAVVCHSDLTTTGSFACSHPGLNQLQHNIEWGQRGNFLDIPTDCPQRDERLGWTGDAQVFFNTAAFNMDVSGFFKKWMRDVRSEQSKELGCPTSIPDVIHEAGTAAWGDCCTIIPWNLYESYGDLELLREQYPTMLHWLSYVEGKVNERGLWQTGFQHGDWLALDGGDQGDDRIGATDVYLIANAFYANSTWLTYQAANLLGLEEDAARLEKQHQKIVSAFRDEFITKTGRLVSDTQTAAVIVLWFDLCEEQHRTRILQGLVENLERHHAHLTTGFVGTPYLCHVLSENGHHELAGKIVLQEDFPSWLYAVNMGATTIWERWNSMNPDGTISDTGMTSFNHYAYGSIGEWLYRRVCGLQPAAPGYKKIKIEPQPFSDLAWAEASLQTGYGDLSSCWQISDGMFQLKVQIPVNTTAQVILPYSGRAVTLGSGSYTFEEDVK